MFEQPKLIGGIGGALIGEITHGLPNLLKG
jgi:hypothetical protein